MKRKKGLWPAVVFMILALAVVPAYAADLNPGEPAVLGSSETGTSTVYLPILGPEDDDSEEGEETDNSAEDSEEETEQGTSVLDPGSILGQNKSDEEESEPTGVETQDSDTGSGGSGWLSGSSLLRIGIGVLVGFVLAAIIFAIVTVTGKKHTGKAPGKLFSGEPDQGTDPAVQTGAGFAPARRGVLPNEEKGTLGKVHNIGRRHSQQDTMGWTMTDRGLLVIMSDGMGGLVNGDQVSQEAVRIMIQSIGMVNQTNLDNPMYEMLARVNEGVLKMLGSSQIYKSGATFLAVLTDGQHFHWIAVGDSHIYLYTRGHLIQMNTEHVFQRDLVVDAVNRKISFARVNTDAQKNGLVSFLGMGDLKYVAGSMKPVDLMQGDKLLLMSDGVFNTVPEQRILQILEQTGSASEAAAVLGQSVLDANNPKQDNFTCIILDF